MLLIERGEGVETKIIKSSYSSAGERSCCRPSDPNLKGDSSLTAGTAFVTFDNVKVPVENLLGTENKGLQVILSNFNQYVGSLR